MLVQLVREGDLPLEALGKEKSKDDCAEQFKETMENTPLLC